MQPQTIRGRGWRAASARRRRTPFLGCHSSGKRAIPGVVMLGGPGGAGGGGKANGTSQATPRQALPPRL